MVKNPLPNVGDIEDSGLIPGMGKFPWIRKWQPISVFLPGKFHGQKSLAEYSPWGHKEPDTTKHHCIAEYGLHITSLSKYWVCWINLQLIELNWGSVHIDIVKKEKGIEMEGVGGVPSWLFARGRFCVPFTAKIRKKRKQKASQLISWWQNRS